MRPTLGRMDSGGRSVSHKETDLNACSVRTIADGPAILNGAVAARRKSPIGPIFEA
jgi:hypothetical protein